MKAKGMGEEKKHINYTAADIEKYLSGQMTAPEMHAIEKAALDDPFLAEAIEGYAAMEQKDWSKELAALKSKLDKQEDSLVVPITKTSITKWWKAAAAVLLIGTSITIAYLFTGNNATDNTAIAKAVVADSAVVAYTDSSFAANVKTDSISANAIAKTEADKSTYYIVSDQHSKKETLIAEVKPKQQTEDAFTYKPAPQPAVTDDAKDIVSADEAVQQNAAGTTAPANTKKMPAATNANNAMNEEAFDKNLSVQTQNNKERSNNSFNAQVVTEDNKPVAFAQVNVPKSKTAVYTDVNGNFKVTAQDSAVDVVVISDGYIVKRSKLENAAKQNKIVLQPNSNELAEVVTIGKKKAYLKKEVKKDTLITSIEGEDEDAEPSVGWSEYNNYLNNNIVLPGEAKEKNIHGVVEVFVKLTGNGDIKEVKVNKPLCTGCDAEAVRLVKEGPKWDVKKNKPAKVKVKITF